MATPATFDDRLKLAYVNVANTVAAMDPTTPDLAKYKRVAMQLSQGGQSVDWFVRTDMLSGQSMTDATTQAVIEARLTVLLLNLIKLGFGS
jgi:hypothetical protein